MSDISWHDIAYQERHGVLPDRGMTAAEFRDYYGDPSNGDYDPEEVAATEREVADRHLAEQVEALRDQVEALQAELKAVKRQRRLDKVRAESHRSQVEFDLRHRR